MNSESVRAGRRGPGFGSVLVSLLLTLAAFAVFGENVEFYGIYLGIRLADSLPRQALPGDADTIVLGIKSGCTALATCVVFIILLQLFSLARRAGNPALRCQKCGQDLPGLVQLTCPKCQETA